MKEDDKWFVGDRATHYFKISFLENDPLLEFLIFDIQYESQKMEIEFPISEVPKLIEKLERYIDIAVLNIKIFKREEK